MVEDGKATYASSSTSSAYLGKPSELSAHEVVLVEESREREASATSTILNRLKSPTASDLARKRKVQCNLPKHGKSFHPPKSKSNPKNVTASARLTEFPGENFTVSKSNGQLFCNACREEIALKKTIIETHVKTSKHASGKECLEKKEARERDIAKSLEEYDNQFHPKGESLSLAHRFYRVKVVRSFMKVGVPLNKIDCFRELLEEEAFSLTSSRHLSDFIDVIGKDERKKEKEEIEGRDASIIFDRTTHVAEALNIILRFVFEWKVHQRLIPLLLVTKPMNGEELAHQLLSTLSVDFSIPPSSLLAAARDCASVNNVAIRHLKILYPNLVDIGCFNHTLDHVGEKMATPNLEKFMKSWVSLVAHSACSRYAFKATTGQFPKSYSEARWWSKYETMVQVHDLFSDIPAFVNGGQIPEVTTR